MENLIIILILAFTIMLFAKLLGNQIFTIISAVILAKNSAKMQFDEIKEGDREEAELFGFEEIKKHLFLAIVFAIVLIVLTVKIIVVIS